MMTYTITTRSTGLDLGTYTASTARDAVESPNETPPAVSQSLEADVADSMIALDCAEIDRLELSDVVAAQAADGTLDCEWSDRDIATMLRDIGAPSDDDAAIAKVRRIYIRRMCREFLAAAS